MYLEKPKRLITRMEGVKLKHRMNTIKMWNLRKQHKAALLGKLLPKGTARLSSL